MALNVFIILLAFVRVKWGSSIARYYDGLQKHLRMGMLTSFGKSDEVLEL